MVNAWTKGTKQNSLGISNRRVLVRIFVESLGFETRVRRDCVSTFAIITHRMCMHIASAAVFIVAVLRHVVIVMQMLITMRREHRLLIDAGFHCLCATEAQYAVREEREHQILRNSVCVSSHSS